MDVKEAQTLIHPTLQDGPDESVEYEMDNYGDMDELTGDDLAAMDTGPEAEENPEEAPAPIKDGPDWEAVAKAQEEELARFRASEAERRASDFERRKNELSGDERAEFIENYYKEQTRLAQMEVVRQSEAEKHPLATVLFAPIMERFQVEIDKPEEYSALMDSVEGQYSQIIDSIVDARVKQEMDKFYAEAGQQWGVAKLGDAQPKGMSPRNPVRGQYEQQRTAMMQSKQAKTVDDVASLIRKRQRAK